MGEFVGERRRETEKERERDRERRGSETDVPKLYPTENMNSLYTLYGVAYYTHFYIYSKKIRETFPKWMCLH